MNKLLLTLLLVPSLLCAAVTNTMTGTNVVPSGSSLTGNSGSTFDLSAATGKLPQGVTLTDGTHTGTLSLTQNLITGGSGSITLNAPSGAIAVNLQAGTMQTVLGDASLNTINIPGGVSRGLESVIVERIPTPQDYGAVGDGSSHPLSSVPAYSGSLATAQAFYSFTLGGCTYDTSSATVNCSDATFLAVGEPISGAGIPAATTVSSMSWTLPNCTTNGTTTITYSGSATVIVGAPVSGTDIPANTIVTSVASGSFTVSNAATGSHSGLSMTLTDAEHFTLSATPTAAESGVTLTSSYVTSLTQELDYCGMQKCFWLNGAMYLPPGTYLKGSSSLRGKSGTYPSGNLIQGAGPGISTIVVAAGDGPQIMQGHGLVRDLTIQYAGNTGGTGSGIVLSTGHVENNPPNYTYNWHIDHVQVIGFANGILNQFKWDEGSITRSDLYHCGTSIKTEGNLDTLKITACNSTGPAETTSLTGVSMTSGSPVLTCASTTGVYPGMLLQLPSALDDGASVVSVDSGTQLTLDEPAGTTVSGTTAKAQSIGLWVRWNGRAVWSGGVLGGQGYMLYGSDNVGAILTGEDLHFEGTGGTYVACPVNGLMTLVRDFFADSGSLTNASVEYGQLYVYGGTSVSPWKISQTGRCDVRGYDGAELPVTDEDGDSYIAGPWYSAPPYDAPGSRFWPVASAATEGMIVAQYADHTLSTPPRLWQCKRTSTSTFAWTVINGAVTSDDVATVAHGGTGTASPSLVAGSGISITGSFPNQTINASVVTAAYMSQPSGAAQQMTSTTFSDVNNTTLASVGTGVYKIDIFFDAFSIDAGLKWQVSGTATMEANHRAEATVGTSAYSIGDLVAGESVNYSGSISYGFHYVGFLKVTGAGSVKLQAAQATGTANATYIGEAAIILTKVQ